MKNQTNSVTGLRKGCLGIAVFVVAFAVAAAARGALANIEADGKPFSEGAASSSSDASGKLTVTFAEAGNSIGVPYGAAGLKADFGVSYGSFIGDYSGLSGLSFRFKGDGKAGTVSVRLRTKNRSWWYTDGMQADADPENWVLCRAAFDQVGPEAEDGWNRNELEGTDMAALFADDIKLVEGIEVTVAREGLRPQTYVIDEFMLSDASGFVGEPAVLTPINLALESRFGVLDGAALNAAQRGADVDKDGQSDYYEILAGTNPDDADSVFGVIIEEGAGQVTLTWPCVKNGSYKVLRADDLMSGFFPAVEGLAPTAAELTGGWMDFSEASVGAKYYKVVKE